MSDGSPSDPTCVSKYFSHQPGMDESLSDFKMKKISVKCPKDPKKPSKPATRKPKKGIKGQKDIRTALKPKKNELITYSNEFDKVCKQSGIDVDSEQIQLAIALSKSVQNNNDDEQNFSNLSTKDRTGKIRKTLQEYGFKVPDVKSRKSTKRRVKKYRKDYKLILSTNEEKLQIVADRYAQVLLKHVETEQKYQGVQSSEVNLYHIGTQIPYEVIKSDDFFYIEDLIEQSSNSVGSLLKNWSEIPGRPVSPVAVSLDTLEVNFSECICSPDELDSILSGQLNTAQKIVKTLKRINVEQLKKSKIKVGPNKMNIETVILLDDSCSSESNEKLVLIGNSSNNIDIERPDSIPVQNVARSCSPDMFDDEVSSILENTKDNSIYASQEPPKNITDVGTIVMDLTECVHMNSQKNSILHISNFQALSQQSNISKRRSNDLMEITDCVAGSSQPLLENIVEENVDIDLTGNSDIENAAIKVGEDENKEYELEIVPIAVLTGGNDKTEYTNLKLINKSPDQDIASLDLTQSSHSEDELPMVLISGRDTSKTETSFDSTIILNEEEYKGGTELQKFQDGSEGVNTRGADQGCIIEIQNSPDYNQEKTVNNSVFNEKQKSPVLITEEDRFQVESGPSNNKNIVSDNDSSQPKLSASLPESRKKSQKDSFFDEFVYRHSDEDEREYSEDDAEQNKSITNNSKNESVIEIDKDTSDESGNHLSNQIISNDLDLTQSSNNSIVAEHCLQLDSSENPQVFLNYEDLGRKDGVSIVYDEIEEVIEQRSLHRDQSNTSSQSVIDHKPHNSDSTVDNVNSSQSKKFGRSNSILSNCSQNSEVFEISDNELNYSINQSKYETPLDNFDFGGMSIMDDLSNARGSKSARISKDASKVSNSFKSNPSNFNNDQDQVTDDSFLPVVNIGCSKIETTTKEIQRQTTAKEYFTPFKLPAHENISIGTPSSSDYVIKTNQVTPMLNYDAMTTPERNKELNKYGLKPFKRKRAIQLLTHLYNQTHPIIESCSNDHLPSPSKKLKPNSPQTSPKAQKSPKKQAAQACPKRKSPKKLICKPKSLKSRENNAKSPRKQDDFVMIDNKNNIYETTNKNPVIKELDCSEDDWVFQKKEKAKVHSCRVPLHIAFHNYISARPALRDAVLRYEPVNIDDIHKGLLGNGLRFDPKDLLKFMDKKCITVKTAESNNKKR